jgi:hypothetical protein
MDDSPTETEPSTVLTPDTENATYFDAEDVEESTNEKGTSVNHSRLRLYNRNTWKDRREENKEVTHRRDNLAILDALSGQLELTKHQKAKARRIFDNLNLGDLGKPARLIAFGVCAVVANDDVPNGSRYHPQMNDPDELFVGIAENLEFSDKQLHSVVGVVNNRRME